MNKARAYYDLAKPGIIYGNLITTAAGFFVASRVVGGPTDYWLLFNILVGIAFVIGSGCVLNNYIDRGIDAKMERTSHRGLVTGAISGPSAIVYAICLGVIGLANLIVFTNILTAAIAFLGLFFYVVMYSLWKRRSMYGAHIGSIAGAVPPVVGYCAVVNRVDAGAVILFFILVFWQMPHFFAIAIRRAGDYAEAGIPVLPAKKGIPATKLQMLYYITAFVIAEIFLNIYGYAGSIYMTVVTLIGLAWLILSIQGLWITDMEDSKKWARKMFFFSLIANLGFCIMAAIGI